MNELKLIFLRHTTLRLQQQKHVLRVQSLLVKIFVKVASQLINKIARQVTEKSHRLKCNRALVNALFWYLYSFYSKIGNLFNSGSLRSMFGEDFFYLLPHTLDLGWRLRQVQYLILYKTLNWVIWRPWREEQFKEVVVSRDGLWYVKWHEKKKESHFCLSSVANIYFCNTKPPRFSWVPSQYIACSSRLQRGTEFLVKTWTVSFLHASNQLWNSAETCS